jgi:hypothetical protein
VESQMGFSSFKVALTTKPIAAPRLPAVILKHRARFLDTLGRLWESDCPRIGRRSFTRLGESVRSDWTGRVVQLDSASCPAGRVGGTVRTIRGSRGSRGRFGGPPSPGPAPTCRSRPCGSRRAMSARGSHGCRESDSRQGVLVPRRKSFPRDL